MEPPGIESGTDESVLVRSRKVSRGESTPSEWRRGRWRKVSSGLVTVHRSNVVNRLEAVVDALERGDLDAAKFGTAQLVDAFADDARRESVDGEEAPPQRTNVTKALLS